MTKEKEKDEFALDSWETESSGGELFKWEKPGQKVTGLLTGRRQINTKLGVMTVYDVTAREGDIVVPGTKSLNETMKKYPANGKLVVQIEFVEEKKGNFPNPFKLFTVRTATATEERLNALGIKVFNQEATTEDF